MERSSRDEILTYWLIPAEPARSWFRSVITDLARRFEAPIFEPHVTLYVTTATVENPVRILETALANLRPFRLSISGIDFSDEFTKTLFVQFRSDAALTSFSEKLRTASVSAGEYELNPHLSLIYKTMRPEMKRQIVSSLSIPFTEIEFDAAKAVISPAKIESREDVESWRIVAQAPLGE
jgi:2'-5' RNA ligase